jgi:hypothetical protein
VTVRCPSVRNRSLSSVQTSFINMHAQGFQGCQGLVAEHRGDILPATRSKPDCSLPPVSNYDSGAMTHGTNVSAAESQSCTGIRVRRALPLSPSCSVKRVDGLN